MSARQSISFLKRRFDEVGIRPDTRRGQNFLIDLNLQRVLVETADVQPHDLVLEVGAGTGSLTGMLADRAAAVVSVEVDRRLHQLASEELFGRDNVTLLVADALENKNRLNPVVLETVAEKLAAVEGGVFKLAANLPYNIATPLISNLLSAEIVPRTMTVTIQKELAERITAEPSTKDYSALSIWIQSQCQVRIERMLGPSVFWPRPKVESAIIQVVLDEELRARIPDRDFFHAFVRSMFFHRRKFLRSVLASATKGRLSKAQVDEIMAEMQFDADTRAEQLDVPTMLALCETVRESLGARG